MKKIVFFTTILIILSNICENFAPFDAAFAGQSKRPNIVFILADDLGFADLKCYGHPCAKTPNLDKLASEGTRFTQCYMPGITCQPSRTGLMTGKSPARFKSPKHYGYGNQITITELLRKQGYTTGHFGKWCCGNISPGMYGIDTIKTKFPDDREDKRGRDAYTFDAAIKFIENNKDRPFYINVWGKISHVPINPNQAMLDRFGDIALNEADFSFHMQHKFRKAREAGVDPSDCMRRYLAEILALDDCVGRLLDAIDEQGLRENTIIVFSSDQGPELIKDNRDYSSDEHKKDLKKDGLCWGIPWWKTYAV